MDDFIFPEHIKLWYISNRKLFMAYTNNNPIVLYK